MSEVINFIKEYWPAIFMPFIYFSIVGAMFWIRRKSLFRIEAKVAEFDKNFFAPSSTKATSKDKTVISLLIRNTSDENQHVRLFDPASNYLLPLFGNSAFIEIGSELGGTYSSILCHLISKKVKIKHYRFMSDSIKARLKAGIESNVGKDGCRLGVNDLKKNNKIIDYFGVSYYCMSGKTYTRPVKFLDHVAKGQINFDIIEVNEQLTIDAGTEICLNLLPNETIKITLSE